jgi:homopolymeric O-antigen transport system ATP-binding protein
MLLMRLSRLPSEIESFCELGHYLHFPMRTYSTGMTLQHSFAIATSVQPEILVLDELIGTGDESFSIKAKARMEEIVSKLQILIIATHDLNTARTLCNRGVALSHGNLVADMGDWRGPVRLSHLGSRPRGSMRHLNLVAQFA